MGKGNNKLRREQLVEKRDSLPTTSAAWVRADRELLDWDLANKPDPDLIKILWQSALIAVAIIGAAYLGSMWMAR